MKRLNILLVVFLITITFLSFNAVVQAGVAKINNIEYDTIEETAKNAQENDTIILIDDIDTTKYMQNGENTALNFAKNVTLDLNGHTINTYNMNLVYTGINLTIKNGQFTTNGSYALFIGDNEDTDNVLVSNIKTKGGINVFNATNVTFKDVDSVGQEYYAVWADAHAKVTILSGNYSTLGNYVLGITSFKAPSSEDDSYIHVRGGNFVTTNNNLVLPPNAKNPYGQPIIYGGIFDTDPTTYKDTKAKVRQLSNGNYEVYYDKIVDVTPIEETDNVTEVELGVSDKEEITNTLNKEFENLDVFVQNSKIVIDSQITNPSDTIKNKITDAVISKYKDASVVNYFDISIKVIDTDSGNVLTTISNLNSPIKFKVLLPEELINKDHKIVRKYYIIRDHEDTIDILNASLTKSGQALEFCSDKFSTYALAYVDEKKKTSSGSSSANDQIINPDIPINKPDEPNEDIQVPSTYDKILYDFLIGGISLCGITICIFVKIKNN